MKKINLSRLSYGVVAVLALGLSGCYFDDRSAQEVNYSSSSSYNVTPKSQVKGQTTNSASKSIAKSTSSSEPAQKSTPGPKRSAAPQLPVIQ